MRPYLDDVKRLCQRIVEEQAPESFSSLVEQLNELLEDDAEGETKNSKEPAA